MFKKTLLSLAVASSVVLTGCIGSVESGDDETAQDPNPQGLTWPIFNPGAGQLPIPSDLNFGSDDEDTTEINEADGSFSVTDSSPPVTTALNQLSGASTVAPAVVRLNGQIDADSVDSRAFALLDPTRDFNATTNPIVPNPNQNVFLIELEYASGDPVLGLKAGEVPTASLGLLLTQTKNSDPKIAGAAAAEIGARFANPNYEAEVVTLDGTSAIRINPTKPLNPFKRYLVVVTKEVLDVNGDPIIQSPTYEYLSAEAPATLPLRSVQTLINGFWEKTAAGFFAGITNNVRPEGSGLTDEDIALSYSFTTSNDEKVLSYILDPVLYLEDTIRGQTRIKGVKAALAADTTDFAGLVAAANSAESAANVSATAGAVAQGIQANLPAGTTLPVPADRGDTATFDPSKTKDVTLVSAIAGQFVDYGQVNAYQGTIKMPYYLGVPTTRGGTDAEGAVINTQSWKADATIASVASGILLEDKPALAQSDPMVSTVVNYRFALPDLVQELDIPVLVLRPTNHTKDSPTIIYQHGITTDRSTALTFGSALANATGAAVVAIDHPAHGVTPFSRADQEELALTLLTGAKVVNPALDANDEPIVTDEIQATIDSVVNGTFKVGVLLQIQENLAKADSPINLNITDPTDPAQIQSAIARVLNGEFDPVDIKIKPTVVGAIGAENAVANAGSTIGGLAKTKVERHFDYTANSAQMPTPMTATSGASGSLFINLGNFTNTRDKNRQSILDLVNLRMSLGNIDLDGDPNTTNDILSGDDVYFVGHSLGAITGIPFVSIMNDLAPRLASRDPSITTDDIMIKGSSMLTPGGGIVRTLENSPNFSAQILGGLQAAGLEQGDANLELFLNVNQAAVDSADPINFVDNILASSSPMALHQVNGELTIPNSDNVNYGPDVDAPFVDNAFDAPLAGTEPLARLLGATAVTNENEEVLPDLSEQKGVPLDPATITRYLAGTHSTPVIPRDGDLDERVFAEMVGETASIVNLDTMFGVKAVILDPKASDFDSTIVGDPDITEIVEQ